MDYLPQVEPGLCIIIVVMKVLLVDLTGSTGQMM